MFFRSGLEVLDLGSHVVASPEVLLLVQVLQERSDQTRRARLSAAADHASVALQVGRRGGQRHQSQDTVPSTSRSEEHTSELPSLMRNSYAVFCLKKKNNTSAQYN